ncbi:MAG: flippase [Candidatus Hadarchaeum sp.]|uniref:flippase n=1 Tax=Candidatus Hadarchaeum sp. TaxID=2883567 RepID=UPI003D130626
MISSLHEEDERVPDAKEYAKRLIKGSAIVFVALIGSQLVAFLLRMFLARSLTVAEYGLFYAVFTFVSFFGLFRDLGFGSALAKYIPEFNVKKRFGELKSSIAFTLAFEAALSLLIVALLYIFSGQLASGFFKAEAAAPIIQVLAVWFFVLTFTLFLSVFQGFQDMPVYALLQFLRNFLVLILAVIMVGYFGFGVTGVALAYLIELSVVVVLAFLLLRRRYPFIFRAKTSVTKPLIKKLSFFALPVFLGGLGGLIIGYMDTLMITGFRTLSEVGFYQVAQPVSHFLWYFPTALVTVFFPMVSEFWARREEKLLSGALRLLVKFSFIAIIPGALVFIAFPEIVINLLFGPRYLAGATALQILSATAVPYTLFMIMSSTMQGIGKPIVSTKVVGAMAILNFFGNWALIPLYGIEGAAATTLVSYVLGTGLLFYYSKRIMRFTAPASSLAKTILGGILTLFLIFGLKSVIELSPWVEAFVVIVPSLVFYIVWILATKAVTREDLELIARIVPMPRWLVRAAGKVVGK